jgi:glycosyltransferase involved in cell wall biosynthesis
MVVPDIGFDYTAAIHQAAGIGRYARELALALSRLDSISLRLFTEGAPRHPPAGLPPGCTWCPSILSERTHARLWHRLRLPIPIELWTGKIRLFHATDFSLPPTLPGTRTVLTIHDLSFEHFPHDTMPGMLGYLKSVVPRSARRADVVIAVSEATRQDIIACYGIAPEKVRVVPHGVSLRFTPSSEPISDELRAKYYLPDEPFILSVGTLQPRKNHLRLAKALALMRHPAPLVIVGGRGWAYDEVKEVVEKLSLVKRVIFAGFADDDDLPALYRSATVLAYPALFEGFGMPVLEAMACGTPVVTSNASSLPEAAGDAALLVDPLDEGAIAAALDRLLEEPALRSELVRKGLARAAEFTWDRAARQTFEIYEALLRS